MHIRKVLLELLQRNNTQAPNPISEPPCFTRITILLWEKNNVAQMRSIWFPRSKGVDARWHGGRLVRLRFALARNNRRTEHKVNNHPPFSQRQESNPEEMQMVPRQQYVRRILQKVNKAEKNNR